LQGCAEFSKIHFLKAYSFNPCIALVMPFELAMDAFAIVSKATPTEIFYLPHNNPGSTLQRGKELGRSLVLIKIDVT